jgi:TatD DNase family protein
MMLQWIDSHCHLDAPEFAVDRADVFKRAQDVGVQWCVMPAVQAKDFESLQRLAKLFHQPYALGIHPLYVSHAQADDLLTLENCIQEALAVNLAGELSDPRLVAVGEIGLDFFVPSLCEPSMREKQMFFYQAQLKLAQKYQLPVILHVRKSADQLLSGLRRCAVRGGIAHAFNGSLQQAQAFVELGFVLGFGGTLTFDRALQIRRLATQLPLSSIVLETDAPDIPPHWLYRTQSERQSGQGLAPQNRNEPSQLPQIAQVLAQLRSESLEDIAQATFQNTLRALPQLQFFQTA